jgi:hypothetical protein
LSVGAPGGVTLVSSLPSTLTVNAAKSCPEFNPSGLQNVWKRIVSSSMNFGQQVRTYGAV